MGELMYGWVICPACLKAMPASQGVPMYPWELYKHIYHPECVAMNPLLKDMALTVPNVCWHKWGWHTWNRMLMFFQNAYDIGYY